MHYCHCIHPILQVTLNAPHPTGVISLAQYDTDRNFRGNNGFLTYLVGRTIISGINFEIPVETIEKVKVRMTFL